MIQSYETELRLDLWENSNNAKFYELLPKEHFESVVEQLGLSQCNDLQQINPYIQKAKTILEVGSAYGRVTDYLLSHQFSGKIYAVERSQSLFNAFYEKYGNHKQVIAINNDIRYVDVDQELDIILWPWCGISDFGPNEQLNILHKLKSMLHESGLLILETPELNISPVNACAKKDNYFMFNVNGTKLFSYVPTHNNLQQYADSLELNIIEQINYQTTTGRSRMIHIFQKN